jgi:DUF4097 and DUF4098 domain-containing protein YvlB
MKTRTIALILLAAALLGVTGLCALTTFGTYRWVQAQGVHIRLFAQDTVSVETKEARSFPVDGPLTLEVDTSLGDIQVSAQEGSAASVEIVRKAWGETQAAAQAEAGKLGVEVVASPSRLKLSYQGQDQNRVEVLGVSRPGRVSFNIKVPAETSVILKTGAGDINLSETRGKADLEANFGQVTVNGLEGGLAVRANSAGLVLKGIAAGDGDITAETSFAGITVEDLHGGEIQLRTASGEVLAKGIEASGALRVENQFSRVQLEDLRAAEVQIKNEGGEVQVRQGEVVGPLEVRTTFNKLVVQTVRASEYNLQTSQGNLVLDGAQGRLDLTNQFGEIQVSEASQANLNLKNESGAISFAGSLDEEADHSVATTFSDIRLSIPGSSALSLDLETEFGKIDCELPVTLTGQPSETHLQGTVNGGGSLLKAVTSNGVISIKALEEDQ